VTRPAGWLARFALLLLALAGLTGCNTGYQQINGEWKYVTLDEGYGRRENPIAGADAASFEKLGRSGFARDRSQVYYQGKPLEGADAATFENLKGSYWRDKDRVYYFDHPIEGADPGSYGLLRSDWARDANNVYVGADPVNPKDLATFEIVNNNWARDSLWYYPAQYARHAPIEVLDRETFQILDGVWAKDCCRVFYFNRIVEGADPATFEVVNDVRGRDKDYYYLMGSRQRTVEEEEALRGRGGGR
jgi:hypothetical protein